MLKIISGTHIVQLMKAEISTQTLTKVIDQDIDILEITKHLFYRCQFHKALEVINQSVSNENDLNNVYKLIILKSKSLYELNKKIEAKESLQKVMTLDSSLSDYLYLKASFFYFDGEYDLAKKEFKKMLDTTSDKEVVFKALLGLGNVSYSESKKDEAFDFLKELEILQKEMTLSADLEISLKLFKGTILLYNNIDRALAKELFEKSFDTSLENNWNFFAQRSLYNLAKWYKFTDKLGESQGVLKVLDMYLKNSDSKFLASLVNYEFRNTEQRSDSSIEVDMVDGKLFITNDKNNNLELKRWPLLLKMAKVLVENPGFVSKEKICNELWPGNKYLPRTYDPRIYDVVARLKKRIEQTSNLPLIIESGVSGYKIYMA